MSSTGTGDNAFLGGRNLESSKAKKLVGGFAFPICTPTTWKMSISELTSLQKTLNTAIDTFKAELAAQNLTEPSLNTLKLHPIDEFTYLPTPAMYEAHQAALASCLL